MFCFFAFRDFVFFFKQKTAYEMRISDWSSDVCSSDLAGRAGFFDDAGYPTGSGWDEVDFPNIGDQHAYALEEIGRASCRERVCQYVYISVVAVSLKKKKSNSMRSKR